LSCERNKLSAIFGSFFNIRKFGFNKIWLYYLTNRFGPQKQVNFYLKQELVMIKKFCPGIPKQTAQAQAYGSTG
jgi:hypothetical protein